MEVVITQPPLALLQSGCIAKYWSPKVTLPMPFHWHLSRNLSVIVHNQRRRRSRCNFMERARKIDKFFDRLLLPAQLHKIDIAFDHRLGHARNLCAVHITKIDNSVEPAIA